MQVQFLFCINKKPYAVLAWLIALATGRLMSHVAIGVIRGNKRVVYHAKYPISVCQNMDDFYHDYHVSEVYEFYIDHEQTQQEMIDWLDSKMGIKFSIKQLILNAAELVSHRLAKLFGKSYWNGQKRLICVEFVARFLAMFFGVSWQESYDTINLNDGRKVIRKLKKLD